MDLIDILLIAACRLHFYLKVLPKMKCQNHWKMTDAVNDGAGRGHSCDLLVTLSSGFMITDGFMKYVKIHNPEFRIGFVCNQFQIIDSSEHSTLFMVLPASML